MNASYSISTHDREQLCQIILKSIHNCGVCACMCVCVGPDKFGRAQAHMHIHQTVIVPTMSRSPQAGLTKTIVNTIIALKRRKNLVQITIINLWKKQNWWCWGFVSETWFSSMLQTKLPGLNSLNDEANSLEQWSANMF